MDGYAANVFIFGTISSIIPHRVLCSLISGRYFPMNGHLKYASIMIVFIHFYMDINHHLFHLDVVGINVCVCVCWRLDVC